MFREVPRRGWALFAHTLSSALAAVAAGTVIVFLAMVAFGFLAEEGFRDSFVESGWEPILRSGVGLTAIGLAVALAGWAVALPVARLATAEQLARNAEENRATVPAWSTRHVLALDDPFGSVTVLAIFGLSLGGVAILLLGLALAETARHDAEGALEVLGIFAAFVGACALIVLALVRRRRSWTPRWTAAVGAARGVWHPSVFDAAVDAERTRRRSSRKVVVASPVLERALARTGRIGTRACGALLGVAIVVSLVTLYARQPCRRCDQLEYRDFGEALLDVLARTSTVALAAALAGLAVALVLSWAARMLAALRLSRRAGDPSHARPDAESLAPAFREPWPLRELGLVLTAAGGGIPLAVAWTLVTGRDELAAVVLGVVALVGIALLTWSEGHAARARNRMREAWSPGDVRHTSTRRARTARA